MIKLLRERPWLLVVAAFLAFVTVSLVFLVIALTHPVQLVR